MKSKRRKITIRNETQYRTADVRTMIARAAQDVFDPGQKPVIHVRVVWARRGNATGCASLGGSAMTLRFGKGITDHRMIGALIVHELGHLRGLDHKQMRGGSRWTWKGVRGGMDAQTGKTWTAYEQWLRQHEWARAMPLRIDTKKKAERLSGLVLVEVRREQTVAALERWTKRERRAATQVRKLKARLRYYDRRAAALGNDRPIGGSGE